MKVPAVVLAGGKAKPEIEAATGQTNRALIPVNGVTMLSRVVRALRESASVDSITVVGDVPDSSDYVRLPDGGGFVENVFAGVDSRAGAGHVLVSTSDVPFLTSESVDDLVRRGIALEADVVYPIVPVADCYARYPGIKRTAARLREGEFTGGNLMLVRAMFMREQRDRLALAYALRKSPVRLAFMLGIGTILRFAAARLISPRLLALHHAEAAGSRFIGGTARALISPYPELATDIDSVEDLVAIGVGGFRKGK